MSIIKHSRMVDRQFQQTHSIPEALHYYRARGYDPRAQLRPTGQYNMLDPGVPVIQDPTCWSCQPKLSNQEYESLRSRVLHEKLSAAGHPLPLIPSGPRPPPFDPDVHNGQLQAKRLPPDGPGNLALPSTQANQPHEGAGVTDVPSNPSAAPGLSPSVAPPPQSHVDPEGAYQAMMMMTRHHQQAESSALDGPGGMAPPGIPPAVSQDINKKPKVWPSGGDIHPIIHVHCHYVIDKFICSYAPPCV